MLLVLITSNNFMTGTGLKKCKPPNLSLRTTDSAISPIGNDDVLLANKAWAGAAWSKLLNNSCLTFKFSTIASIIKSDFSADCVADDEVEILANTSFIYFSPFCGSFSNFFLVERCKLDLIELTALFKILSSWSTKVTFFCFAVFN